MVFGKYKRKAASRESAENVQVEFKERDQWLKLEKTNLLNIE